MPTTQRLPQAGAFVGRSDLLTMHGLAPRSRTLSFGEMCLLVSAVAIWLVAAIAPVDRPTWLLENVLLILGVGWVVTTFRRWPLSQTSYSLIFIFFVLHVAGAHYTYGQTPMGFWLEQAFNLERNHYDRIVHGLFGLLLVLPFREQIQLASGMPRRWASLVAFLVIVSLSTIYELLEWTAAIVVDSQSAAAFLGMQGDPFDTQKDIAFAILGAAVALTLSGLRRAKAEVNERGFRS